MKVWRLLFYGIALCGQSVFLITRDESLGEPLSSTNRFRLKISKNLNETPIELYQV